MKCCVLFPISLSPWRLSAGLACLVETLRSGDTHRSKLSRTASVVSTNKNEISY